jgi:hypothetical protein
MKIPVTRLFKLHQRLDDQIDHEQHRRLPDFFRLQRLKKLRLAVRDRLYRNRRTPLAV